MNRNVRGFTLIEVLLATVLLAAGLALAFATLRSATAMPWVQASCAASGWPFKAWALPSSFHAAEYSGDHWRHC